MNLKQEISNAKTEAIDQINLIETQLSELTPVAKSIRDELFNATIDLGKDIHFSEVDVHYHQRQATTLEKLTLPHVFFRVTLANSQRFDICFAVDGSVWILSGFGFNHHHKIDDGTIDGITSWLSGPILDQARETAKRWHQHGS